MITRAIFAALTFCSTAQVAQVAHAERLGIFVRITDSEERPTGIDQLALLEQLASRAEFAKGLTVVRASEVLTSDVRRAVIGCGEKLECIASKLTATEIDLGLLATIDASSDPALVLVLLIDAKTGKLLGRALEEASRSESDSIAHFAEINALRLLDRDDREIVTLKYFDGLDYNELAERLQIPKGTVMSRLFHARRKLQAKLER